LFPSGSGPSLGSQAEYRSIRELNRSGGFTLTDGPQFNSIEMRGQRIAPVCLAFQHAARSCASSGRGQSILFLRNIINIKIKQMSLNT
jgi:hypothetical protein